MFKNILNFNKKLQNIIPKIPELAKICGYSQLRILYEEEKRNSINNDSNFYNKTRSLSEILQDAEDSHKNYSPYQ